MATTALDTLDAAAGTNTVGAPAPEPAGADGSLGVRLGLADPLLEDLKKEGAPLVLESATKKRPKMTHTLFFENDNGMKKMLKTFPNIKFRGKGREYEDVSLLLQHYRKWFNDLYPYGEHFEDLVWKARQVLQDKEKEDDGTISDPRERLHAFRLQYKNTPKPGSLTDEARARIEANRQRALELKRQKQGGASSSSAAGAPPAEEMDMEELWRMEEELAAASKVQSSGAPASGFDDEDPFGFGGGFDFDDDGGAAGPGNASKPAARAPAPAAFDDEEDVFGFGGGGFDDMDDFPAPPIKPSPAVGSAAPADPPKVSAPAETKAPAASGVDPEIARRIAENRAKALARKAAAAAAAATAVTVDAAAAAPVHEKPSSSGESGQLGSAPMDLEEDDGFDFGCSGFDDP